MLLHWTILLVLYSSSDALDNGLALTPPMGWLTWARFLCTTDCKKHPKECISEQLVKRTVDAMVRDGYAAAGYQFVGIDDCWLEGKRSADGKMVPAAKQFPNGMKVVADYVHSHGLKFGMYQDYGTKTCAGYPGVLGHEQTDVDTFVEWEIDYLKLDGCYVNVHKMDEGYPAFGKLLNSSGRPIVYSCSWPAYQEGDMKPNYTSIAQHCNLWRNYNDIGRSWGSVRGIMNWFGDNQDRFANHAGPGHWNDPDMLIIGNGWLTHDQSQAQMAIWSILAAPLIMSVDLDTIEEEYKEILLNKHVISVNQDPLGKQGLRILKEKGRLEVWHRELSEGRFAIAFLNSKKEIRNDSFSFDEIRLPKKSFAVLDLFSLEEEVIKPDDKFEVEVNPTGVKLYSFTPKHSNEIEDNESEEEKKRT